MDDTLLKELLATTGRMVFSPEDVLKIVAPTSGSEKQIDAFNLCDGDTPQGVICKKVGIDSGNFSRSISRWVEEGVMFRVGPDEYPLHIYPLNKQARKQIGKKKGS